MRRVPQSDWKCSRSLFVRVSLLCLLCLLLRVREQGSWSVLALGSSSGSKPISSNKRDRLQNNQPLVRATYSSTIDASLPAAEVVGKTYGPSVTHLNGKLRRSLDNILTSTPDTPGPLAFHYYMRVHLMIASPDGYEKIVIGVNGKPGWETTLIGIVGVPMYVTVQNNLDEPTSIHFHGFHNNGTSFYDGAASLNQCPIPAKASFTYRILPTAAGTYWWHGHHSWHYMDGQRGPIIIYDESMSDVYQASSKNEYRLSYEDERTLTIGDWYHLPANQAFQLALGSYNMDESYPQSILINGRSRFDCSLVKSSSSQKCANDAPLSVVKVERGKSYRLRLINLGVFSTVTFSIDGHPFTVIETDAVATLPRVTTKLSIAPGMRYSILVTANVSSSSTFWIRVTSMEGLSSAVEKLDNKISKESLAVLEYTSSLSALREFPGLGTTADYQDNSWVPKSVDTAESDPLSDLLLTAIDKAEPPQPTKTIDVTFQMVIQGGRSVGQMSIDGGSFQAFSIPPSLEHTNLLRMINDGSDDYPVEVIPVVIRTRTLLEVRIKNLDIAAHPFHFHGFTPWILASGVGPLPSSSDLASSHSLLRRDSFEVPACEPGATSIGACSAQRDEAGWTIVRLDASSPGVWMLHCHVDLHLHQGLGLTFVVLPDEIRKIGIPDEVNALCTMNTSLLGSSETASASCSINGYVRLEYAVHAFIMTTAWCLTATVGILSQVLGKTLFFGRKVHKTVMGFVVLFTIAGNIYISTATNAFELVNTHAKSGFGVVITGFLQGLFGVVMTYAPFSSATKYLRKFHKALGYATWLWSQVTVFLAMSLLAAHPFFVAFFAGFCVIAWSTVAFAHLSNYTEEQEITLGEFVHNVASAFRAFAFRQRVAIVNNNNESADNEEVQNNRLKGGPALVVVGTRNTGDT